jgi:hypothetical protein
MEGNQDRILQKLAPHLCICEWGPASADGILRAAVTAAEKNLAAVSDGIDSLPVLNSLAGTGITAFAFIGDTNRLPQIAGRTSVQLFMRVDSEPPEPPPCNLILAYALKDIGHLDWTRVIFAGQKCAAAGFMFIDEAGKYLHRFYDFLNLSGDSPDAEIHYCAGTNDAARLEDARRLVQKIRPQILPKFRLFVGTDFFKNI